MAVGTILYGRGQLGLIWLKTRRLPAFSDLAILFIHAATSIQYIDHDSLATAIHQAGNTSSRKNTEDKQLRPQLALGWVTTDQSSVEVETVVKYIVKSQ